LIVLITASPEAAREALGELKRLNRTGWIDLVYYTIADKNRRGVLHIRESSDLIEAVSAAAAEGSSGSAAGGVVWTAGVVRAPANPSPGASWETRPPGGCLDEAIEEIAAGMEPGNSALLVILEEHHAERVAEELQYRGRILRKPLLRSQREATLKSSVERLKANLKWLRDLIESELSKVRKAEGEEKAKIEAAIAAGQAELHAEHESLQGRLKALRAELEADLQGLKDNIKNASPELRPPIARRIASVENAMADCSGDLALSILDHMDWLAVHSLHLQARAATAGAEAATAIEAQLHELEVRMRKNRAGLTAALGASTNYARQCMDALRVEAAQGGSERRESIEDRMKKLEDRYAMLKSDCRRLEKESARAWSDHTACFRKSWRSLRDSLDDARRDQL
jgi:uncharacterized membrane protein